MIKRIVVFLFHLSLSYASIGITAELFQQPFIPNCWETCPFEIRSDWNWFLQKRAFCLENQWLQEQIYHKGFSDEAIFFIPGYDLLLKKRKKGTLKEVWAWEISSWIENNSCIVPSFPLEIEGILWTLQKKETFYVGGKAIERVYLEQYWKAFLVAYILGFKDFTKSDIGIDPSGKIRFFDTTSCFYYTFPRIHKKCFHPGFWIELLCWPQYRRELDLAALTALQPFIASLSCLESNIRAYALYRNCSIDVDGLLFRLEKVRSFFFQEGVTLCDFYMTLFPCMGKGLDELSIIISADLGRAVDHGEALYYLFKKCDGFSAKTKREIQKWISLYGCYK